jgi:hypothetical protein
VGGSKRRQPLCVSTLWSVTVYDTDTRSQIQTAQSSAALRSLFELKDFSGDSVVVHFGRQRRLMETGRF